MVPRDTAGVVCDELERAEQYSALRNEQVEAIRQQEEMLFQCADRVTTLEQRCAALQEENNTLVERVTRVANESTPFTINNTTALTSKSSVTAVEAGMQTDAPYSATSTVTPFITAHPTAATAATMRSRGLGGASMSMDETDQDAFLVGSVASLDLGSVKLSGKYNFAAAKLGGKNSTCRSASSDAGSMVMMMRLPSTESTRAALLRPRSSLGSMTHGSNHGSSSVSIDEAAGGNYANESHERILIPTPLRRSRSSFNITGLRQQAILNEFNRSSQVPSHSSAGPGGGLDTDGGGVDNELQMPTEEQIEKLEALENRRLMRNSSFSNKGFLKEVAAYKQEIASLKSKLRSVDSEIIEKNDAAVQVGRRVTNHAVQCALIKPKAKRGSAQRADGASYAVGENRSHVSPRKQEKLKQLRQMHSEVQPTGEERESTATDAAATLLSTLSSPAGPAQHGAEGRQNITAVDTGEHGTSFSTIARGEQGVASSSVEHDTSFGMNDVYLLDSSTLSPMPLSKPDRGGAMVGAAALAESPTDSSGENIESGEGFVSAAGKMTTNRAGCGIFDELGDLSALDRSSGGDIDGAGASGGGGLSDCDIERHRDCIPDEFLDATMLRTSKKDLSLSAVASPHNRAVSRSSQATPGANSSPDRTKVGTSDSRLGFDFNDVYRDAADDSALSPMPLRLDNDSSGGDGQSAREAKGITRRGGAGTFRADKDESSTSKKRDEVAAADDYNNNDDDDDDDDWSENDGYGIWNSDDSDDADDDQGGYDATGRGSTDRIVYACHRNDGSRGSDTGGADMALLSVGVNTIQPAEMVSTATCTDKEQAEVATASVATSTSPQIVSTSTATTDGEMPVPLTVSTATTATNTMLILTSISTGTATDGDLAEPLLAVAATNTNSVTTVTSATNTFPVLSSDAMTNTPALQASTVATNTPTTAATASTSTNTPDQAAVRPTASAATNTPALQASTVATNTPTTAATASTSTNTPDQAAVRPTASAATNTPALQASTVATNTPTTAATASTSTNTPDQAAVRPTASAATNTPALQASTVATNTPTTAATASTSTNTPGQAAVRPTASAATNTPALQASTVATNTPTTAATASTSTNTPDQAAVRPTASAATNTPALQASTVATNTPTTAATASTSTNTPDQATVRPTASAAIRTGADRTDTLTAEDKVLISAIEAEQFQLGRLLFSLHKSRPSRTKESSVLARMPHPSQKQEQKQRDEQQEHQSEQQERSSLSVAASDSKIATSIRPHGDITSASGGGTGGGVGFGGNGNSANRCGRGSTVVKDSEALEREIREDELNMAFEEILKLRQEVQFRSRDHEKMLQRTRGEVALLKAHNEELSNAMKELQLRYEQLHEQYELEQQHQQLQQQQLEQLEAEKRSGSGGGGGGGGGGIGSGKFSSRGKLRSKRGKLRKESDMSNISAITGDYDQSFADVYRRGSCISMSGDPGENEEDDDEEDEEDDEDEEEEVYTLVRKNSGETARFSAIYDPLNRSTQSMVNPMWDVRDVARVKSKGKRKGKGRPSSSFGDDDGEDNEEDDDDEEDGMNSKVDDATVYNEEHAFYSMPRTKSATSVGYSVVYPPSGDASVTSSIASTAGAAKGGAARKTGIGKKNTGRSKSPRRMVNPLWLAKKGEKAAAEALAAAEAEADALEASKDSEAAAGARAGNGSAGNSTEAATSESKGSDVSQSTKQAPQKPIQGLFHITPPPPPPHPSAAGPSSPFTPSSILVSKHNPRTPTPRRADRVVFFGEASGGASAGTGAGTGTAYSPAAVVAGAVKHSGGSEGGNEAKDGVMASILEGEIDSDVGIVSQNSDYSDKHGQFNPSARPTNAANQQGFNADSPSTSVNSLSVGPLDLGDSCKGNNDVDDDDDDDEDTEDGSDEDGGAEVTRTIKDIRSLSDDGVELSALLCFGGEEVDDEDEEEDAPSEAKVATGDGGGGESSSRGREDASSSNVNTTQVEDNDSTVSTAQLAIAASEVPDETAAAAVGAAAVASAGVADAIKAEISRRRMASQLERTQQELQKTQDELQATQKELVLLKQAEKYSSFKQKVHPRV